MDRKKLVAAVAVMSVLSLAGCKKDRNIESDAAGESGAGQPTLNTTAPAPEPEQAPALETATATLQGAPTDTDFKGTITFTPEGNGVRIVAHLEGVDQDGDHGFHVHQTGECTHGEGDKHFTSAGGHFNPANTEHACPPTEPRHAGDLGNIPVTGGTGHLETTSNLLSLSGPNSVVGKAIILHAKADDCKTQPTGDAGDRLACGVITMGNADVAANGQQ
ncbi:MAG TPA: superoxide dismutase family protein [Thermoanaerobaculia bacterium]|nr:superoxide dismutase family protein [Thermoanaerobaculia bacterium]